MSALLLDAILNLQFEIIQINQKFSDIFTCKKCDFFQNISNKIMHPKPRKLKTLKTSLPT